MNKERTTPTDGPWEFHESDTLFTVWAKNIVVMTTSWHSSIRKRYPLKEEARANARLCAAAPALLAALVELESQEWDEMSDEELLDEVAQGNQMVVPYIAARAAIALAVGKK